MDAYIVSAALIGIACATLIALWYGSRMYQRGVEHERLGLQQPYDCPVHGRITTRVPLGDEPPGEIPCTQQTLRRLDTHPVQHKIEHCSHAAKRAS